MSRLWGWVGGAGALASASEDILLRIPNFSAIYSRNKFSLSLSSGVDVKKSLMSSSHLLHGRACFLAAFLGLLTSGSQRVTSCDHRLLSCCEIRFVHRHFRFQYITGHSSTPSLCIASSAMLVARLMKSGHGSSSSSSVSCMSGSRSIWELVLATSSVLCGLRCRRCWRCVLCCRCFVVVLVSL